MEFWNKMFKPKSAEEEEAPLPPVADMKAAEVDYKIAEKKAADIEEAFVEPPVLTDEMVVEVEDINEANYKVDAPDPEKSGLQLESQKEEEDRLMKVDTSKPVEAFSDDSLAVGERKVVDQAERDAA